MELFALTIQVFGGAICVLVAGHLIRIALQARRARALALHAQTSRPRLLQQRLDVEKTLLREREAEGAPWSGYRKFVIERKVIEADNICSFYLRAQDRKGIALFQPGQYLTFRLEIAGQQREVIRCYSLSDRPRAESYRVTIKKRTPPAGKPELPGGLVSSYFHEELAEGAVLDVKAPGGHFKLDIAGNKPVVLVGGGIGITPVLSMLHAIIESGSMRETWFFYGVTNAREHLMQETLHEIARSNPQVHVRVYYSRPERGHQAGHEGVFEGRVTSAVLRDVLPSRDYEFYLCGPGSMMQDLTAGLEAWGVPEGDVHFEAFGPSSVKKLSTPADANSPGRTFSAVFAKSGKSAVWREGAGSLLELAEAFGVPIDSGCRAGNCGTCLTGIVSGEVTYLQEAGAIPEPGTCLACICVPQSDLVLDA